MPDPLGANQLTRRRLYVFGFAIALVAAWFCYRPALSGVFQLDDYSNLNGLAAVEDASSAVSFSLSGSSGPLGRPLALATFAMQAGAWPNAASELIAVNIALHFFNAIVLAVCLYQLALMRQVARDEATLVALAAASLWVILPLLATSSLLVVQRMTTLSALFTLSGLAGYLAMRRRLQADRKRALAGMSVSLVVATLLAALAKESGLLLPTFVLVIEATLLERPRIDRRSWNIWVGVFLILPTLMIVAYIASRAQYPEWLILRRGFDAWERLLTEARVLWLYIGKALVGLPATLGIYQNAPPIVRSLVEPASFVASISWLLLLAVSLVWRRRVPLLAFAVLWFLAGHLIESTTVPLELYFEHRNYLPIAGPIFALGMLLISRARTLRRAARLALPTAFLVNAYFLYSFASLWGEPSFASRYWALKYPDSSRAVTNMATYQLTEESVQRGMQTIGDFVAAHQAHAYLGIQELNLGCLVAPATDRTEYVADLEHALAEVDFTYTAGTMLSQLFDTVISRPCKGIDASTVIRLATALRANRRYRQDPLYNQFHHKLLAGIARKQGDLEGSLEHLRTAIRYQPSSELNMMMVTALADNGDFEAAREFIENARGAGPTFPIQRMAWRRDLGGLAEYVNELEEYARQNPAGAPAGNLEQDQQ